MPTLRIGDLALEGVSYEVCRRERDGAALGETSAGLRVTVNGQPGQAAVVAQAGLLVALDEGDVLLAWDSIHWNGEAILSPTLRGAQLRVWAADLAPLIAAIEDRGGSVSSPGDEADSSAFSAESFQREPSSLLASEQTAASRRARNRHMTAALRQMGGKYRKALDGQKFAAFSLFGTESWEDYATASMTAMHLETTTDLAEAIESLDDRVARIESLLEQIRDAITPPPTDP